MEHDVKIKTKRKTLATYSNLDKYETRVLDYLTSESKSTYNSYIYCSNIFYKYKYDILVELFKQTQNEKIKTAINKIVEIIIFLFI